MRLVLLLFLAATFAYDGISEKIVNIDSEVYNRHILDSDEDWLIHFGHP